MSPKTSFHAAADRFANSIDGSRKIFSNLVDVFSLIASRDFSNDWAPDYAERFFKFNRAQKKFQRDFRDWSASVTEQEWNMVRSLFGGANSAESIAQQGGDQDGNRSREARVSYGRKQKRKAKAVKRKKR